MCLKSLAATSKVVSYSVQAYIRIICLRCVSITPVLMGDHPPDAITLSATDGSIDYFLFSNSVLISLKLKHFAIFKLFKHWCMYDKIQNGFPE